MQYHGTEEKLDRILAELEDAEEDVWIQDLARKCKLASGSIYYFINKYLLDKVELARIKKTKSKRANPYITLVRLKK